MRRIGVYGQSIRIGRDHAIAIWLYDRHASLAHCGYSPILNRSDVR